MADGGSSDVTGNDARGSTGSGHLLQIIVDLDNQGTSTCDDTERSKVAGQKPTKHHFKLPRIDDTRQTLFSPTPKQMIVHLPDIGETQLNTAFNNSISDGGQTTKERAKKEAASSVAEKELQEIEAKQKGRLEPENETLRTVSSSEKESFETVKRGAEEKAFIDYGQEQGAGADERRSPRPRGKGFTEDDQEQVVGADDKRNIRPRGKGNSDEEQGGGADGKKSGRPRGKKTTLGAPNRLGPGGSRSDLDQHQKRRSRSHSRIARQRVRPKSHDYVSDGDTDAGSRQQRFSRSSRASQMSSRRYTAKSSIKHSIKQQDSGSESDSESDSEAKKKTKQKRRGKKVKRRWMGWDTGRLAPHKHNKLPQFKDLAVQIGDWINGYVLKQKSYTCQPLPGRQRESQFYVRDYLACKSINEMFELMTTALLLRRPDRPLDFLVDFTHTMGRQLAHAEGYKPCCAQEVESEQCDANRECRGQTLPKLPPIP